MLTTSVTNLKGDEPERLGTMRKYCASCGRFMGTVPTHGRDGVTHGLCLKCYNILRQDMNRGKK